MKFKKIVGFLMILSGVLLVLNNMGIVDYNLVELLADFWPSLLIIASIYSFIKNSAGRTGAVIVFVLALLIQLKKLEVFDVFAYISFWPLFLILVGLWFVVGSSNTEAIKINDESLNMISFFSDKQNKIISAGFKGGSELSFFGDNLIDFRNSNIESGEINFTIFSLLGETRFKVPDEWNVIFKGAPLLSDCNDFTNNQLKNETAPTLIINTVTLLADIIVEN